MAAAGRSIAPVGGPGGHGQAGVAEDGEVEALDIAQPGGLDAAPVYHEGERLGGMPGLQALEELPDLAEVHALDGQDQGQHGVRAGVGQNGIKAPYGVVPRGPPGGGRIAVSRRVAKGALHGKAQLRGHRSLALIQRQKGESLSCRCQKQGMGEVPQVRPLQVAHREDAVEFRCERAIGIDPRDTR